MQDTRNQYGLIGKSLSHSFSKSFFEEKFKKDEINASYLNFELPHIESFVELFKSNPALRGLNVTVPYKTEIIPFLDELSINAEEIGAVNTIEFKSGKLIGHNTDAFGFQQSIKPFLRNVHERALILGTGGASKAVAYVLKNLGVEVKFLSRNPSVENEFSYDDANELMVDAFKLIVNCTPIGTAPNVDEMPKFPIQFVNEDHLVIDLIYNPEQTKFLRIAKENGADTLNGLSMLQHQALKAWEIWNA
ncbi:MAG: shikimate dehydrogenase [Fluviicola sp.]|nr:MAG: shikimate dehydrogenase [Fluviicola sp.]